MIRLPRQGGLHGELPTVGQILEYPSLLRGDPIVIAGAAGLGRRVRWVHMSEAVNVAALLRGGELLLTMGLVFPDSALDLSEYVERLVGAGAAALVIGLGPRYEERLPPALVEAAERHGLPLVALRRKIAFLDVTEEVHPSLVDAQVRELKASESIHMIFSALAVQGSKAEHVLRQVVKLSGLPVVLESTSRQILAFDPASRSPGDVLAEWKEHGSPPHRLVRTFYDPLTGWLQTMVGARGNDWGRLILMAPSAGARDIDAALDPTSTVPRNLIMLIEQAASTLAIGRLVDREAHLLEPTTQSAVLSRLLSGDFDADEIDEQARAFGLSFRRMSVSSVAFHFRSRRVEYPRDRVRALRALADGITEIVRERGLSALVAPVDDFTIGMVSSISPGATPHEDAQFVLERLRRRGMDVIAARGAVATDTVTARAAMLDAMETVSTAVNIGVVGDVVTAADLGIHGLVYALRDDARVTKFAAQTIHPLVAYDEEHGTTLVSLLRHFLYAGRNKTLAARNAYVSRPWMHERLRLVAEVLNVDLDDEETCLSLQFALLVHDARRDEKDAQRRE